MAERAYFLYDAQTDVAELIDPVEQPEGLRQYLACLATGLGDAESILKMLGSLSQQDMDNLKVGNAFALFHHINENKVKLSIAEAARTHRISSSDAINDIGLLRRYDDYCWMIDENGIVYDSSLHYIGEKATSEGETGWYYEQDTPEHKIVRQLMDYGMDDIHVEMQSEFDPATSTMYSDRIHDSLGRMESERYTAVVTILSEKHPVRQLIAQNKALGDNPTA